MTWGCQLAGLYTTRDAGHRLGGGVGGDNSWIANSKQTNRRAIVLFKKKHTSSLKRAVDRQAQRRVSPQNTIRNELYVPVDNTD